MIFLTGCSSAVCKIRGWVLKRTAVKIKVSSDVRRAIYFDFQLLSEVLVKRVPNSRGNLRTVKIYTVIIVYRRKLVTFKVYFVNTDVLCRHYFVYVSHLIKFVCFFCCYRIFLVNKDIHLKG